MAQGVVRRVKHRQKFDDCVQPWSKVFVHESKKVQETVWGRDRYAMLSVEVDDNWTMHKVLDGIISSSTEGAFGVKCSL